MTDPRTLAGEIEETRKARYRPPYTSPENSGADSWAFTGEEIETILKALRGGGEADAQPCKPIPVHTGMLGSNYAVWLGGETGNHFLWSFDNERQMEGLAAALRRCLALAGADSCEYVKPEFPSKAQNGGDGGISEEQR